MQDNQKLSIQDLEHLPNRKEGKKRITSACPFCMAGEDRFVYWPEDGNYWCNQCYAKGFVLEMQHSNQSDEWRQFWAEEKQKREEAARLERMSAIERVSGMTDKVEFYHSQVDKARDYWHSQGLTDSIIEARKLGYSALCPTYQKSPSYVIPYFESGKLTSIRHRLAAPNGSGKYRPEFAGLPPMLFNTDALIPQEDEMGFGNLLPGNRSCLLVEGEIKSIYLTDVQGLPAVGIAGINCWRDEWTEYFKGMRRVYIAFDPGSINEQGRIAVKDAAEKIGHDLKDAGLEVFLASLSAKPDDWFVVHHQSINSFIQCLKWSRRL